MKIISLNTWHSKLRNELRAYIADHLETTDVFCFQEANKDDQEAYSDLLEADFHCFAAELYINDASHHATALFVRKQHTVEEQSVLFEPNSNDPGIGMATVVRIQKDNKVLTVCNVHGAPYPGNKLDSPSRLRQTELLLEAFKKNEPVVIVGDFNLLPDTKSIQQFSKHGFQDLIQDYNIPTTRNRITFEAYPESAQHYADYAFVASVTVEDFTVPAAVVSDHQPLELRVRF